MKNCEPQRVQGSGFRGQRTAATFYLLLATCYCLLLPACAPKAKPPTGYFGPTEPMADVIAAINANNEAIPSLWSRHYFEATIVDQNKKSHFVNGDGVLLYRSPGQMRIVGTKDIAGTIFEIGTTADRYWVKVVPELDTLWWGEFSRLDRLSENKMPIRPDLVVQVLGIGPIDKEFLRQPVPIMRFNNDADAYMFVWARQFEGRWIAQKEIWYDRQSKLPKSVLLFDANGRIVLRAYLGKHQPVEVEGVPRERWPKVATEYKLFFPETQGNMSFELSETALQHNGVPNERSIRFPQEPGVSRVIQVDADANQ